MCGIAGAFAPTVGAAALRDAVGRMVGSLDHRGPDDQGFHTGSGLAMGMSRLSIIDVAGGHQPIANEDGTITIVCNGEIYNHVDLRRELQRAGHEFRTSSDVEVILHLYEDLGARCLKLVQGMFAVAIWDERRQRLFLGRDRLGIKPLYYADTGSSLFFGSELKALVRAGMLPLQPDPRAVDAYFSLGYVPAPLTIYQGVRKLEPGHVLVREGGQTRIERYWRVRFAPDATLDARQCEDRFLELFGAAVRTHLMSEVPLGAFLSGGVDSGLLVALMSEAASGPVRTFTIGFSGSVGGYLDERGYARTISQKYGTLHTEIDVEPRVDEVLDDIVASFDEPFADDSVIPSYYICRSARQAVTVALTGLGGDELFGGYERYLGFKMSLGYDRVPGLLRDRIITPLVDTLPERRDGHYTVNHMKRFARASTLPPAERILSYVTVTHEALKSRLFTEDARRALAASPPLNGSDPMKRMRTEPGGSWLNEAFRFDTELYLPDDILALTDRLSMAHGLELRVPFLDHAVVEFCATIPAKLKIKGLTKKYLLRRAAARYLPPEILNHRKQGFASPMASWLRSDLQGYVREALSAPRLRQYGFLQPEPVAEMMASHLARRESYDKQLFTILMFQKWCERFL